MLEKHKQFENNNYANLFFMLKLQNTDDSKVEPIFLKHVTQICNHFWYKVLREFRYTGCFITGFLILIYITLNNIIKK